MTRIVALVSAAVMGLSVCVEAEAATLYRDSVACTGNYSIANRNCTGSDGNSYTSIATAIAAMVAGDTLRIRAGTWVDQISVVGKAGTSSAKYTIEAYPGETVVLQRTGTGYGMLISSSQWIVIKNIDLDGINSTSTNNSNRIESTSTADIELDGMTFQRWPGGNGLYVDKYQRLTIRNSTFKDQLSPTCAAGTRHYGFYAHDGSNLVFERNIVTNNPGGGVHIFPGPHTNVTISKNKIYRNNLCDSSPVGGLAVASDSSGGNISGVVISHNLIYENGFTGSADIGGGGGGIRLYASGGTTQVGTQILRNTIYNNRFNTGTAYGINIQSVSGSAPSGTILKNNHVVGNESGQIIDAGTGTVSSGNRTTGAITDCTVSTTNFTQKSGSACIDAGVDDGLPANGQRDIGAFETFTVASCEVPTSAPNTIQVSFTSNVGLVGDDLTTFTARLNTVSNGLVGSPSKIGDTIVSLPVASSYLPGDTVDISWSSGGLTDNMRIGGSLNQPFLQTLTNQSCTNRSGGGGTHVLSVVAYRFHGASGPEDTTDIRSGENVASYEVIRGGAFRVRFAVTCTVADCPPTAFYLRYSTDFVNYALAPDIYDAGNIGLCGTHYGGLGVVSGVPTTNQMTTPGTFIPGGVVLYATAIPTISGLLNGYKTELEYCMSIDDDATGSYGLQLVQQNGGAVVPVVTPVITVVNPMGSAF